MARSLIQSVVVTATIRPDQNRLARVAPRIGGRVQTALVNPGDVVAPGQVLATLDSVEVGEAHTALVQARSELQIADADLKRARSLVADEIIPRKDFLRAQADRAKAASAVRAATDRLRLLGGSLDASRDSTSTFTVTAPFAGTVIEKRATPGDLASPNEAMFTIADLSQVWIEADLPEAALSQVLIGANAKINVPAHPSRAFSGRVEYIGASVSRETRTVPARIVVSNEDKQLKPEMFATAAIEIGNEGQAAMTVPDTAIVLIEGKQSVFVLDSDGYEPRAIEPGRRIGGRTVVKAGVNEGEEVVVEGAYVLKARMLKSQLGHGH
jgi:cobalt-zinc-cadmium efflux system membrane fusion protein